MTRFRRLLVAVAIMLSGMALVPYIALPSAKFSWQLFADAYQPKSATVHIRNLAFVPDTVIVPVGATVSWLNEDPTEHTVVSTPSGPLNSGSIDPGGQYSFTFNTPGTFEYFCTIHPFMTGRVIVSARASFAYLPIIRR